MWLEEYKQIENVLEVYESLKVLIFHLDWTKLNIKNKTCKNYT